MSETPNPAPGAATSSDPALDTRILEVLDMIRPALQMDGGDVAYMGVDDGWVKLHLVGACGTCPSSTMTLQFGIEQTLKDKIPGIKGVVPV